MINKLTVHGFKSIERQTIELGALNVLIGANGVGADAKLTQGCQVSVTQRDASGLTRHPSFHRDRARSRAGR